MRITSCHEVWSNMWRHAHYNIFFHITICCCIQKRWLTHLWMGGEMDGVRGKWPKEQLDRSRGGRR